MFGVVLCETKNFTAAVCSTGDTDQSTTVQVRIFQDGFIVTVRNHLQQDPSAMIKFLQQIHHRQSIQL
jgi:hypothetical protein